MTIMRHIKLTPEQMASIQKGLADYQAKLNRHLALSGRGPLTASMVGLTADVTWQVAPTVWEEDGPEPDVVVGG